jgi:predicted nucleic acid-binding protein
MKVLLDVNIILASGWRHHQFHSECVSWLDSLECYTLCPITELGFLRISMSPAFGASFNDALTVLQSLSCQAPARHIACDQPVGSMPGVSSYKDTTDAYLVHLADYHDHQLATLDAGILNKDWAANIAFNPISN